MSGWFTRHTSRSINLRHYGCHWPIAVARKTRESSSESIEIYVGADREQLIAALKADCIPTLREAGFKGTFPDFYRASGDFVALVNFQFFSSGGSFCVNLSYADPARENVYFRPETELKRLKVSQTTERCRLGATKENTDKWYSFGKTSYGEYRGEPIPLKQITATLNELFASDAEDWWRQKQVSNS
jgi:hypothetical protein